MRKLFITLVAVSTIFLLMSCINGQKEQSSNYNGASVCNDSDNNEAMGICLICNGEGACVFEGEHYEHCPCCNGLGLVSQKVLDAVGLITGESGSGINDGSRAQIEKQIRIYETELENYRAILQNTTSSIYEAYYANEITRLEYQIKALRYQLHFME